MSASSSGWASSTTVYLRIHDTVAARYNVQDVVYLRLHDTVAARYNVQDVLDAILNLCLTQLREKVGKLTLDESFSSREPSSRT